jgi:uncharacterized protein involved in outer membrane biogenesis
MLKNKWLQRFLWVMGVWIPVWLLAWLALPPLVKHLAESRGSQALGRTLTIGAVDFKPWTLELTVSDIKIASADGKSTQFAVAGVYVDAEVQSLFRLAPVMDAIRISQPELHLTHLGDGHYDVDDLLERFKSDPAAPASAPARFALHNIELTDGSVDFTDHVAGAQQEHHLRKLQLALPFVSNFDSQRNVTVQPRLAFELNGSTFDTAAQATPFAQTRKGEVDLHVAHLDIAPYLPYLPASLPVRVQGAVMDSDLKLTFEQSPTTKVTLSGDMAVSKLRVADQVGGELLAVDAVRAKLKELRPLEQSLVLESLDIDAPRVTLARNHAGVLVLPGVGDSKPAAKAAPDKAATSTANPWKVELDKLELKGGQVRFTDESTVPVAKLALTDTHITVRDVHWPFEAPAKFDASAQLQAPDAKKGKPAGIALQGEGTDATGSVKARVSDLALTLAAPCLNPYLVPQVQGVLEGELLASWKGGEVQLAVPRLAAHDFALLPPAGNTDMRAKDLPSFKLLQVTQVAADLGKHSVTLGSLALRGPKVRVQRDDDGQWMFSHWLKPPVTPKTPPTQKAATTKAGPAWMLRLNDFALDDGTLTYVDKVPQKTVFLELSALQSHAKNLSPDGKKPVPLTLSAKVRTARTEPGNLRFDGSVMWGPLVAQGALQASQLPLQAVAPYVMSQLRLDLLRADTSFKGQVRYASLPAGPQVQVSGDAAVEELVLNSLYPTVAPAAASAAQSAASTAKSQPVSATSEELLNWKALSVPGIEFTMAPGVPLRLKVREVSLSDFYARLIISPEGRLVLQDIVRPEDVGPPASAQGAAGQVASAASAPVSAASAPKASAMDPVIDIGTIKLVNGRVAFSDRFIKPNYSASLTELGGSLSHFSSRTPQGGVQMADIELRGRAEGTASLEITGKVNPLAKPLALDITGKVRDLELSPLSSYAIKYAGYGIERGKLSVDVKYSVAPDGQLQASNNIILNQLVFGDEVEGAANRLPVKLAVALLADRNGVIDLNVPLSGSLNDPQFRVWPIVWKIVGNIIAKAITSPFNLISGIFSGDGGADELSTVAFDAGTTHISTAAQANLDKVAKALADKPSLRLTVVGTASLEREAEAIQRDRLSGLLLAEKRRVAASAGKDVTAVTAVTPEEYPALLKEVYRRSDIKKPRNLVGFAKDLPQSEMEALLLGSFAVNDDTVRELALNRSIAVRDYLVARQLPSDRLFMGAAKTSPTEADWLPRAELNIEHH